MALKQKVSYREGHKVTADLINDTVNTAVRTVLLVLFFIVVR